jgi:archaellum component FlaC
MSDIRLTNEKMLTFTGHEKIGTLKAAEKLMEFGEKQNTANEALAANVNDLIKRVCAIEDREIKDREIMKKIADELTAFKRDLDRVRLSSKLNNSSIERLDNAIKQLQQMSDQ